MRMLLGLMNEIKICGRNCNGRLCLKLLREPSALLRRNLEVDRDLNSAASEHLAAVRAVNGIDDIHHNIVLRIGKEESVRDL
jgi:hypothetical protein